MVTTVYLIRHCEALANINEVYQGQLDGDISEKGELQLEKLKERCRDIPFQAMYSSPLIRAYKTAQAGNYYHKLPIITDKRLMEINVGEMEGKSWKALHKLFPEIYIKWEQDFRNFKAPAGESIEELYNRMVEAMLEIVRSNSGKVIGVFSHGCAIRNFMAFAHGYGLENIDKNGWYDNTSICRIDFDEALKPTVVFENDCEHILRDEKTAPHTMWWKEQESSAR